MKIENTLRAALLNNLTEAQREELQNLVTEYAYAVKDYGRSLSVMDSDVSYSALTRANNAWLELTSLGLAVSF